MIKALLLAIVAFASSAVLSCLVWGAYRTDEWDGWHRQADPIIFWVHVLTRLLVAICSGGIGVVLTYRAINGA